ncbi:MAG: TPM domain-containing protein [Lachnospiraceae bacterium]|nr:TPM domain-containing protein [Lachnospiraceae bacterium]
MNGMIHKISHLLISLALAGGLCLLLLPSCITRASADKPTSSVLNDETGYTADIYDNADLLTQEEEAQLLNTMYKVTKNGYAVLVTINENPVDSEVLYTDSFYKHHYGGTKSGAIMLIDMELRILRLECYNDIDDVISSTDSYTIVDNSYGYASQGKYFDCANQTFKQVSSLLSGMNIPRPVKYIGNALLALLMSSLIGYIMIRTITKPAVASMTDLRRARYYNRSLQSVSHKMISSKLVYSPMPRGGGGSSSGGGGGSRGGSHGGGGGHHSGGSHRF